MGTHGLCGSMVLMMVVYPWYSRWPWPVGIQGVHGSMGTHGLHGFIVLMVVVTLDHDRSQKLSS